MTNTNLLSAALFSVVGLAGAAHGAIVVNPPFSGATSTFECWDFFTPSTPTPADPGFFNPNGVPVMQTGGTPTWMPTQFGKDGVWVLDPVSPAGVTDSLNFNVPNDADPNDRKLIWLEVKWFGGFPGSNFLPPLVSGFGANTPPAAITFTSHSTRPADNNPDWSIDTWVGFLEHCPPRELLIVQPNPNATTPTSIDYVCINTLCIPTPGAGALLTAGAMVLGVRRRTA